MLKTLKTLTELNRPVAVQYMSQQTSQKKAICINSILVYSVSQYYTNIDKVEVFHILHNKAALLTRRHSERGLRNRHQIIFGKVGPYSSIQQKMLIKR